MLNHPLGPSITNQINLASRYMYFPRFSTYTSYKIYASIPYIHIEPKHSNKPEVNIIKRVITKERPTGQMTYK